jgi:hypothetical protein
MPKIEVSNGELLDKYAILHIKSERISDKDKVVNVINEIKALNYEVCMLMTNSSTDDALDILYLELIAINEQLWDVEDILRSCECDGIESDDEVEEFVEHARSVYKLNDKRASIKKEINVLTKSTLVEEKSYEEY